MASRPAYQVGAGGLVKNASSRKTLASHIGDPIAARHERTAPAHDTGCSYCGAADEPPSRYPRACAACKARVRANPRSRFRRVAPRGRVDGQTQR